MRGQDNDTLERTVKILDRKHYHERLSRTPDERLYSSGWLGTFAFTQCYVSLGDPDGEDIAFTKCNEMERLPFRLFRTATGGSLYSTSGTTRSWMACRLRSCPVWRQGHQIWETSPDQPVAERCLYPDVLLTTTSDGVSPGPPRAGIRPDHHQRSGSVTAACPTSTSLPTCTGTANFNENFPLFNWYVVETDTTRYKNYRHSHGLRTGGPADGSAACGQAGVGAVHRVIGKLMANTAEQVSLPHQPACAGRGLLR